MSQIFRHFIGYLSISDFLKQIPPRNTLIILFFFYTHQSLSTKTKRFGAGCSSPGSWLKINGSVLRDQKVWKKTKELNMCRIYICFEKSLIDKFLRTLKKKISYLEMSVRIQLVTALVDVIYFSCHIIFQITHRMAKMEKECKKICAVSTFF